MPSGYLSEYIEKKIHLEESPQQFTSLDLFFVHNSFLRLLDASFAFHSKCELFIIINDVSVLLCCVEALIKTVLLCWIVCQTQITVHALENSQINWKV